jgi:membrane-associated protease RseP (regulator of RpoE activity)
MFGDILVSVIVSGLLFFWILLQFINQKEFEKRGIERSPLTLIFRSKKGLEAIDRAAKKREGFFRRLGSLAVYISFPLMFIAVVGLFFSAVHILTTPGAEAGVQPILPGGMLGSLYIPWKYWLISIMVILVFHEIMHGLVARVERIPLKSLGIFSVTLIPLGAFVEPDDEELEKKKPMSKLRVYAAGSMGNFIAAVLGGIVLVALLVVVEPLAFQGSIVQITDVTPGSPADAVGIQSNMILLGIDTLDIGNVEDFRSAVTLLTPGNPVTVRTDKGEFLVVPEKRADFENGFIGIAVFPRLKARPVLANLFGEGRTHEAYMAFFQAFFWISFLNLAVGLTNLLPIIPLDGGRMFALFTEQKMPRLAKEITSVIYLFLLVLVIINIGPHFGLFQGVL